MKWLLLAAAVLQAEDWPRFRGPNGGGINDAHPLPASLDKPLWRVALPPGLSSPVTFRERIYLTAFEDEKLLTIALDRATGKTIWRSAINRPRKETLHKLNHPAAGSIAVNGSSIVAFFTDFGLIAYDMAGREKWRVPMGPFNNIYGMGASPVIVGDRVVLICDQSKDSFAAAYALSNGEQVWRTARKDALSGHSTPIVHNNWIIAPASFVMEAYDARTGKVAWSVEGLPSEIKSVPVIAGNMIYIHGFNTPENDAGKLIKIGAFGEFDTNKDGKIVKDEASPHARRGFEYIDLNRDGVLDPAEWEQYRRTMQAENALLAYEIGGGLKWRFSRSIPQLPSPLVYRGVLYMLNEGGVLTTLDAATGKLHRQARVRGEADQYYASPVAGDGKIYIASHTGQVLVLKAGPEQELLFSAKLDDAILATPALVGGRVLIRTRNALYAF
jgi:outer membrane protein assembly factor BamB